MAITHREPYNILDIHISPKKYTFSWKKLVKCFINGTSFELAVKFLHDGLIQKA